jgi:hypothetical protein
VVKPFQETVNIQPQTISTGQSQLFQSLGDKLSDFSSRQSQALAEKQIAKASAAGSAAGQQLEQGQKPEFKEQTFIGGIAKKAYNNALRSSYVASVDRDLNLKLNELKTLHSNDLMRFNDAASGEIKGAVEGSDPLSRDMILQSANNFMDSARVEVQKNNIEKNMAEADEELSVSSEYATAEAEKYAFNGDDMSSAEALNRVVTLNDARVKSGKLSTTQAALLNDEAVHSTRVAKNRGEFNRILNSPSGVMKAAKGLSLMAGTQLPGMDVEQHDELLSTLSSDLSQFITMQNRQEVADEATLKSRQAKTAANFAVDMSDGVLNQDQLNKAARNGDLSESQYSKLTSKLSSQGVGVTDISLQLDIQSSIVGGLDMTDAIVNNMGTHLTMADGGALLRMQGEYGNEESILNNNNTKRARNFLTESTKITGLMGRLTSDGSRRTAEAIRTFDQRVLDGEDPFAVADDLYDHDSLTKVRKKLARKNLDLDNVPAAIIQLTEEFKIAVRAAKRDTQIKSLGDAFNRDLADLNNLRDLQESQQQFANALKSAQ